MPREVVSEALRKGLYTRIVGRRILFFESLGSTMDEAACQARAGAEEGAVIVAETQTSSRGRFGRTWVSQPGNLYLSIVFYPDMQKLPLLGILGGLAVAQAIRKTAGLQPRLKWPNDVLLGGKKVAGVLVESATEGDRVEYAILGIGINVGMDVGQDGELSRLATSLNAAAGRDVTRDDLLRNLLHQVDALYIRLGQGETPLAQWIELLDTLGQRVQVSSYGDSYSGIAEGIDDLGNLQLRLDDGRLVALAAGDVTLQGAAGG